MKKNKWTWMPHPAHFICSSDCRFVLATYVGKYIVSTVGELWPDSRVRKIHADVHKKTIKGIGDEWDANYFKEFGYTELGYHRKYETMVFKAVKSGKCKGCPYTIESGQDVDMAGYNESEDAYKGHLKMCNKWSKKP